jgi:hypothetical protein
MSDTKGKKKSNLLTAIVLLLCTCTFSCTPYKSQEVSFRHPTAYPGMQSVAGALIAADSFNDRGQAKQAFGFDIRGAGLLPIQVIVDNTGPEALTLVPEQTFLIDNQGGMWNLLDSRTAYQRVESSSEFAAIAKEAGRGSVLGAAGGALIGAAVGIVTGSNVLEALGKGAAVGAAGGAVLGGGAATASGEPGRQISRDLATKQLENKPIQSGDMARGFLFFPDEAGTARQLRLQIKEISSQQTHTLLFPLQ